MDWLKLIAFNKDGLKFIIVEDLPNIGFYLYIYKDDKNIRDELQDTLQICKMSAFEDWGVPYNAWKELNWIKLLAFNKDGLKLIIEEDLPHIGFYLYIYKNDECIRDERQDTIKICKKRAFEEWGVPYNEWKPVK